MNQNLQSATDLASRSRRIYWNVGVALMSSISFTGAVLLSIIWHLDVFFYLVIAFLISCIVGAIAVDIRKSIILTYVSMILGSAMAAVIFLAPHALFSTNQVEFDLAAISLFTVLGKIILIGLVVYFLGALFGAYIGEKSLERMRRTE
jgi:hypothetical protein